MEKRAFNTFIHSSPFLPGLPCKHSLVEDANFRVGSVTYPILWGIAFSRLVVSKNFSLFEPENQSAFPVVWVPTIINMKGYFISVDESAKIPLF